MTFCPHCKREISAKANYCSHPDCGKPVRARQPLLSSFFRRWDGLIIATAGVVVGLLLGLLGANLFGLRGASDEPEVVVVRQTVEVEREVEVTRIVAVESTPERIEVPVLVTQIVEVPVTRVVEPTATPQAAQPERPSPADSF